MNRTECWQISSYGHPDWVFIEIVPQNEKEQKTLIAKIPYGGDAQMEARIRLIAAAPDLLEALHMCRDFLEESEEGYAIDQRLFANAAIAKAQGDSDV